MGLNKPKIVRLVIGNPLVMKKPNGSPFTLELAGQVGDLFEVAEDFADMFQPFARARDHYGSLPRIHDETVLLWLGRSLEVRQFRYEWSRNRCCSWTLQECVLAPGGGEELEADPATSSARGPKSWCQRRPIRPSLPVFTSRKCLSVNYLAFRSFHGMGEVIAAALVTRQTGEARFAL